MKLKASKTLKDLARLKFLSTCSGTHFVEPGCIARG